MIIAFVTSLYPCVYVDAMWIDLNVFIQPEYGKNENGELGGRQSLIFRSTRNRAMLALRGAAYNVKKMIHVDTFALPVNESSMDITVLVLYFGFSILF